METAVKRKGCCTFPSLKALVPVTALLLVSWGALDEAFSFPSLRVLLTCVSSTSLKVVKRCVWRYFALGVTEASVSVITIRTQTHFLTQRTEDWKGKRITLGFWLPSLLRKNSDLKSQTHIDTSTVPVALPDHLCALCFYYVIDKVRTVQMR